MHVHSLYVAKYGIILKDEFGIPTVVTEHWSGLNSGEIKDDLLLESGVYQHADKVIVVSEALKTALKNHFGIDCLVINNMVDNRFFEKSVLSGLFALSIFSEPFYIIMLRLFFPPLNLMRRLLFCLLSGLS